MPDRQVTRFDRDALRKLAVAARDVLPPDELEELLNGYEHGRFRTNG